MKPRVLLAHNFYQYAGGEDTVVRNEMSLLQDAGHDVRLHTVHNDDIQSFADKIRVVFEVAYSRRARQHFARAIAEFQPDVVHVHNFFPRMTPSIYDACIDAGVPVVQSLHNYRLICPTSLLMLDGKICERSLHEPAWWAVRHKVYKDSYVGTAAVANMIEHHKKRRTWHTKVDRFITLSKFARQKFIDAGFPADKLVMKPNFVADHGYNATGPREGALYVGRLSHEKGVRTLMRSWRDAEYPLRVVGDGPGCWMSSSWS